MREFEEQKCRFVDEIENRDYKFEKSANVFTKIEKYLNWICFNGHPVIMMIAVRHTEQIMHVCSDLMYHPKSKKNERIIIDRFFEFIVIK